MTVTASYFLMALLGVVFALLHVIAIKSGNCSSTIGVFLIYTVAGFFFDVYLHFAVDEMWNILNDIGRMSLSSLVYLLALVVLHLLNVY